ncbi:MAG: electron transfer flavoprotein-ubiquinone oxidoreductase [Hyphomicrobiaceae bacterium]|nr:electron transfer flavoprotein-ubiquinone oxidoreductase [Hyphomicrobiaceae bacterium]MCC0024664.1 electron transfer flavoprotein-ubiquinone oxidoreductase [Hyphomicrobiaceae bacterium]
MADRESMQVDVVVVGAGPAGLSAAIRLKQNALKSGNDVSIVVLEKAAEIGGHILSGAVIDPVGLNELVPDWQQKGAPLATQVTSDRFRYFTSSRAFDFPTPLLPKLFSNHGCYIASLGDLCRWLGDEAEALGVDVFPGFAATELLVDDMNVVKGVVTGDMGRDRNGEETSGFTPGMELHARYTLIAEGARGSLAKKAIARYRLDREADPQKFGLGIKEIWQVAPENHREGHVEHILGWPLDDATGGGGFVYHAAGNQVIVGHVTHLNYTNPHLSPFDEFQRFKTHPEMRKLLEGGQRIAFGARAMTSGGWQSVPELAFPGGALIGCSAGFMNLPRIKGSHTAILSGMRTADLFSAALLDGRGNDVIEDAKNKVLAGALHDELHPVRNAKPLLSSFGTIAGTVLTGIDLWLQQLLKFSPFGTMHHKHADNDTLHLARNSTEILYPKPDGVLTFDRASSVYLANIGHDENQPVHLKLADASVPIRHNLPQYDEPARFYCPAGVYEVVKDASGMPSFRINAANCVHCKTCDIKDPAQNITWTPPEGGSGPNYRGM